MGREEKRREQGAVSRASTPLNVTGDEAVFSLYQFREDVMKGFGHMMSHDTARKVSAAQLKLFCTRPLALPARTPREASMLI